MTAHHLATTPTTATDVMSRDRPPVLTIEPGDTLTVETLDASGYLRRPTAIDDSPPRLIANPRGHCLVGPIEVRGAEPGKLLAVTPRELTPAPWSWTVSGARDVPVNRSLGLDPARPHMTVWDIDVPGGAAISQSGLSVGLAPFLGVMGLAPAEPGEHSTIPPRTGVGGNIDCRLLGAGATLLLPVAVAGGLLHLGDGHARQGDGEVGGTAIETGKRTVLSIGLAEPDGIDEVHALTPAGRVIFGFDRDLNVAAATALSWMVTWMQASFQIERTAAVALASVVVDLRITQIANDVWGVHAVLADDAVARR